MKVYEGGRSLDGAVVTVDGAPLDPRFDIRRFSRTGFEWTYEGDGPRQLALALLADHLGDPQRALALTEGFMRGVVAELDNAWRLTSADIEAALRLPPPDPLPRGEGEHQDISLIERQSHCLGYQRGTRRTFDLDLAIEGHAYAAFDVLHLLQRLVQPHTRSGRHRRGEAHLVRPVVDAARAFADRVDGCDRRGSSDSVR